MARSTVIAKWREMSSTYLTEPKEAKRGRFEATLFVNDCEVRQTKAGPKLFRSWGVEHLEASSDEGLGEKMAKLLERPDMRILRKGLDSNDPEEMPRELEDPPQDLIDGTADVYADKAAVLAG